MSKSERLGLSNEVKEIKLGKSFSNGGGSYFHTFRYDFKPASVDVTKMAAVEIGERHQVTVSVPYVDKGSGTTHAVFKGSKKPYTKECVLILDHRTGDITLEKLACNVQLKKTRAEGSSKIKPNAVETSLNVSSSNATKKSSPVQKGSPKEKFSNSKFWNSNHFAPAQKCSPLPKSPNSQSSPPDRTSPSVPSVVPLMSSTLDSKHSSQVPSEGISNWSKPEDDPMDCSQIGVLSSSDSSSEESSDGSSSGSESSDEETEAKSDLSRTSNNQTNDASFSKNGFVGNQTSAPTLPSMPQFNLLNDDLNLSEPDSD